MVLVRHAGNGYLAGSVRSLHVTGHVMALAAFQRNDWFTGLFWYFDARGLLVTTDRAFDFTLPPFVVLVGGFSGVHGFSFDAIIARALNTSRNVC